MPTTTKMGISYPSSSDLVKDGATNMGTIATTVDSKTGLVLLNTTSFSAVSSQSINDVFNTNFDNYLLFVDMYSTAGDVDLNLRLRVSATDASGTDYSWQSVGFFGTSSAIARTTSTTSMQIGAIGTTYGGQTLVNISRPFVAAPTRFITQNNYTPSTSLEYRLRSGFHALSTSYTGFTLFASSNFTGAVSVYGYNK